MNHATEQTELSDWIKLVQKQVGSMRFGVVQIIVHEGRVVQIERTEKVRIESKNHKLPD